jgi:hypothetical protein
VTGVKVLTGTATNADKLLIEKYIVLLLNNLLNAINAI